MEPSFNLAALVTPASLMFHALNFSLLHVPNWRYALARLFWFFLGLPIRSRLAMVPFPFDYDVKIRQLFESPK